MKERNLMQSWVLELFVSFFDILNPLEAEHKEGSSISQRIVNQSKLRPRLGERFVIEALRGGGQYP